MKIPISFYRQKDVVDIAQKLLGKFLFTKINNKVTGGIIVETEAYAGIDDKASHAYKGKITQRTKPMFGNGGISYVYLCYGMHYLLNVVTNSKSIPHAVLIRAIEPTHGIDTILERKNKKKLSYNLTSGPGALTKALGVNKDHNSVKLNSSILWIEDKGFIVKDIVKSPRIGIAYAQEHAFLPWRFRIKDNKWTSKVK
jgi:DNA-3-methyladenine glycosylase